MFQQRHARSISRLWLLPGLILLYYSLYFMLRGPRLPQQQVIAHRGDQARAPENTLAAFQKAIDLGVDWLEFDVQMTQDGELVIIHDEAVDRTTNGSGRVADLSLAQIRALDAGQGERVPTFGEVISLAKAAGINILPETKSPHLYPGLASKLAEAILTAEYADKTIIQSFDPQPLKALQAHYPEIQVCLLSGLWEFDPDRKVTNTQIVCPMAEMVVLYPWLLRRIHANGQRAFVWFGVIEHPLTMRLLLALGADGLMVDNPAPLVGIVGR